jgi:endonuclease/exonuclease/phosphatase family metal-dependent hydrolase
MSVMSNLVDLCDSLLKTPENRQIVAMGDFNDNPGGLQFSLIDGRMVNKADVLYEKGEGTIRY